MAFVMSLISDSAESCCVESKVEFELVGPTADRGCALPEITVRLLVPAQYQPVGPNS
jgi:hypothetical protein